MEEETSYDVLMQPFEEELERDEDPDWIPTRVIIPRRDIMQDNHVPPFVFEEVGGCAIFALNGNTGTDENPSQDSVRMRGKNRKYTLVKSFPSKYYYDQYCKEYNPFKDLVKWK